MLSVSDNDDAPQPNHALVASLLPTIRPPKALETPNGHTKRGTAQLVIRRTLARGPGRGPTVVWAQPGCWGFLSPKLQSEELVGLESVTLLRPSQLAKAPYCALLSAQPRPAAGRAT